MSKGPKVNHLITGYLSVDEVLSKYNLTQAELKPLVSSSDVGHISLGGRTHLNEAELSSYANNMVAARLARQNEARIAKRRKATRKRVMLEAITTFMNSTSTTAAVECPEAITVTDPTTNQILPAITYNGFKSLVTRLLTKEDTLQNDVVEQMAVLTSENDVLTNGHGQPPSKQAGAHGLPNGRGLPLANERRREAQT